MLYTLLSFLVSPALQWSNIKSKNNIEMTDYDAKRDRGAKLFAAKFVDAAKLPASYSLLQGKISSIISRLSSVKHTTKQTKTMACPISSPEPQEERTIEKCQITRISSICMRQAPTWSLPSHKHPYPRGQRWEPRRMSLISYYAYSQQMCGKHTC